MNELLGAGLALIGGLFLGEVIHRFKIPSVAGYIIAGLVLGSSGVGWIDADVLEKLGPVNDLALGLIAFNIGGELSFTNLKRIGKSIMIIAFCEATLAFVFVTGIMLLLKQPLPIALLLGAVSSATAPAATVMVLNEYKAKGTLTSTLLGVVAVDDAICLMIYAIASSIAGASLVQGAVFSWGKVIGGPILEIMGSFLLGIILGAILNFFVKSRLPQNQVLILTLGMIVTASGLAVMLDLSALLVNMAIGVYMANRSSEKRRIYGLMDCFGPPVYTAFFVLAGSRLQVSLIPQIGMIGVAYAFFRIVGKLAGASLGAIISHADGVVKKYIGLGLLSQIGVAVGLAIMVSKEFAGTDLGDLIITILLATTVITEIIGPICTKYAITKAGEVPVSQKTL